MKKNLNVFYLAIIVIVTACSGEQTNDETSDVEVKRKPAVKVVSPLNDDQFVVGDEFEVKLEFDTTQDVKNVQLFLDDSLWYDNIQPNQKSFVFETKNSRVGFIKLYLSFELASGEKHGDTRKLVFFSDIVPKELTATKVKSFPHDKSSYTQGLEFYKGRLFEGTGQLGQSILAETDLVTGKILRKLNLENRFFGEGITIINDTIYQITWSEKTCFAYDMSFNKIKEFNYEGEGWGLTNNGKHIIMSNGTNEIVWRDRTTFEIVKRIHAFTDQTDVGNLNELELINGKLYANVYTENRIVEIDTTTGKVMSNINCDDIVAEGRIAGADVLNGIAYNPLNQKIYITGKWWPQLFEVIFE